MITKDNRQEEEWPRRTILVTLPITSAHATRLGIPLMIATREGAQLNLLSCGHYLVETNDGKQYKFAEGGNIRCKPCYHVLILRQSLMLKSADERPQ